MQNSLFEKSFNMDEIIVFLFVSSDYLYFSLEAFILGHFNPFKQVSCYVFTSTRFFHKKNFIESHELQNGFIMKYYEGYIFSRKRGLEKRGIMKGECMMRRNIYKTPTYRVTFVRNIDKSAPVLLDRRFFGPPTRCY